RRASFSIPPAEISTRARRKRCTSHLRLEPHPSRLTPDPRSTIHDPRSTIHDPRSTIHDPRSTIHDPRSTIHEPSPRNRQLERSAPYRRTRHRPARPPHPHRGRFPRKPEHLNGTVLRPVARRRLHFAYGSHRVAVHHAHLRTDAVRIRRRTLQPHTQPGLRAAIPEQSCRRAVLRHREVDATVAVKVRECGAALVTIDFNARSRTGNRPQMSVPVAEQEESPAGVVPLDAWRRGIEVL